MYLYCIYMVFIMKTKLKKWGNSLAVRIPNAFIKQTNMVEDEYISLYMQDNKIIIEGFKDKEYSLDELVSHINKNNIHKEQTFGKPEGNEVW